MSSDWKKDGSERKRELIFHEVREDSTKTLSSRCEVVEIKVNEDAIVLMSDGKRLADNQPVVTLAWDSTSQLSTPLTCAIEHCNSRSNLFSITVSELLKHEYRDLIHITETIFSSFNARITNIHDNPMTFCLLSHGEFSNANKTALESTFRNLVSRFTRERFHVEIKSHDQQPQQLSKTSEEFSMSIDLSPGKNPTIRTSHSGTGPDIDDTERQVREIENSLKSQRTTIEERFQEQRMQNSQIEETLKMLLHKVEQDMPKRPSQNPPGPASVDDWDARTTRHEGHQLNRVTEPQVKVKEQAGPQDAKGNPRSSTMENTKIKGHEHYDENQGMDRQTVSQSTGLEKRNRNVHTKEEEHTRMVSTQVTSRESSEAKRCIDSSAQTGHQETRQNDLDDIFEAEKRTKSSKLSNSSAQYPEKRESLRESKSQEMNNNDRDNKNKEDKLDSASQQNTISREQPARRNENWPVHDSHNRERHNDHRENTSTASYDHQTYPKRAVGSEYFEPEFDMDQYRENQRMKDDFELMHSLSDEKPPRATALNTLFCLDTSASMGEDGLTELKEIAMSIVDGIEDIATDHGIEENLAVVQFGGHPVVAQALTNDYGMVRETIEKLQLGGMSPLNAALLLCLQALWGQGGTFNIAGVHLVPPRVIVITDGNISSQTEGSIDVNKADVEERIKLLKLLRQFEEKQNSGIPNPIVWIPAGKADTQFLVSLGRTECCVYVKELTDRKRLSSYQRIQTAIGHLYVYIQKVPPRDVDFYQHAGSLLDAIASDLREEDRRAIIGAVRAKLDGEQGCGNPDASPNDFDNIYEDPSIEYHLGTRVKRGPDWMWGDQDTGGTGTVVNHNKPGSSDEGFIWVEWDNGSCNQYRFGCNGAYDIWEIMDQFRNISTDMSIEIGCEVTRGPNWRKEHGDEDGGCKGVGVVIRNNENGLIKVRWKENGFIGQYRYSDRGINEVSIRDPVDCFQSLYHPVGTVAETEAQPVATERSHKKPRWAWGWNDEMNIWQPYPDDVSRKIEKDFNKKSRSCLITKADGQSYRILFGNMTERGPDSKQRSIKRIDLNADA